jgi:hypothetical protein
MVTNSFGNRNFMQPMGRLNMHVLFGWTEDGWTKDG